MMYSLDQYNKTHHLTIMQILTTMILAATLCYPLTITAASIQM